MAATARPSLIVLDPVGGAAGDMFIAAALDAWPAFKEPVFKAIHDSNLPAGYEARLVERQSGGLAASGFTSQAPGTPSGEYVDFRRRLAEAPLPEAVRKHALGLLALLAEAESAVHRVPVEQVHFHELADWDTQADIVGAAAIMDLLDGARWHIRPLPLGSGLIGAAHGRLPVPPPAAAHLLKGFEFRPDDGGPGERITPTGAAILRYLALNAPGESPSGTLVAIGTGAGTKTLPGIPNVLRLLAFAAGEAGTDSVLVVEFDIDDQAPEDLATGLDRLRAMAGVRDVVSFQGIGKKGRWVQAVRIMADPGQRDSVVAAVFVETTTLGLRLRREERAVLARRTVTIEEESRPIRVKLAQRGSRRTGKAEADDVAAIADGAEGRARLRRTAVRRALKAGEGAS
jgi:pyridinium-3,5-bisthiocarboxylic acid mononucleotide nickel chelatase